MNHLSTSNIFNRSRRRFFALYSTALLLLLTIDISCNAVWGEVMWIQGRNHQGGVVGWFIEEVSVWYQTLGSTSVVAMIFMGDALLLHRLFVIWNGNWWIMVFPILAYLAAFSLAIIELVIAGKPGGNFFGGRTINFGTPYYTITIGLNIIVTILISVRLLRLSRAISQVLGRDSSRMYTNIVALLAESAAPYSLVGIMFLIPYAMGSDTSIGFGQVWAKLTCLCPQLIVLRVVSGRAWQREMVSQFESTVVFEQERKAGASATADLPHRMETKFAVGSVDDAMSPQESSGSTFAGSPTENWQRWHSNSSNAKLDV
ncbi:hypothetical protein P691DRAFT_758591 [Macrolepiota fuliginosa MF-IS2]|uniref:Uncharacterized protein n=1 Tax=Macrolepiota fuliginosa MF-IS2 TaxID=1400762 RepID=A0A9P5XGN8_9AGAR|nr:hypothetical protein P691DRAFT_758591 [Macrolepiota fuliginosa MF-IS2]